MKLSNRLSTLLAKSGTQREDYWLFTKKVYSLRSGIVHGEGLRDTEINGQKYTLEQLLEKLTVLTRNSIQNYLVLVNHYTGMKKTERIAKYIDSALINQEKLKLLKSKLK